MSTMAVSLEQGLAQLAAIAGAENTRLQGDAIAVEPADTGEIAKILRYGDENRLIVTPTGSGSKLGWGNPVSPNILLSLRRMTAVREHSWQDMTCTVEAGCTWSSLQSALRQHRQMVALDPLWPDRATVGGIAASNDSGAMRLKYGSLRDLILGMTVVLADGTIAKTGGKVVKNVAGYDLHKLMTGSLGTLGVIAEVNFRLHPVEENSRTWTATAPDPSQISGPLRALLDAQLVPTSVQVRGSGSGQPCSLDVSLDTRPECADEYATGLKKIFRDFPLAASDSNVWLARQQLFADPGALVLKISALTAEICTVVSDLQTWAKNSGAEIAFVAQASGLITVALPEPADSAIILVHAIRQHLRESGGSVVALQIPDSLRGRVDVWGSDSNALPLMREIKRQFDPQRILNPGRFVGDI